MSGSISRQKLPWRPFHRDAAVSALAFAIGLGLVLRTDAQENASPPKSTTPVPEIVVTAPKPNVTGKLRRKPAAASNVPAPAAAQVPGDGQTGGEAANGPPLQRVPALDKTGTKLEDLPQSVVVVPRSVIVEQAGTSLADAIRNVSGVNQGGSSSYGFFDRFTIRGMDARIYSDGFPDGDQFNGFPHSINGVQSIEVLKGPGSALFGSGPPGGTINIVHFMPSAAPGYGLSSQLDSYGGWSNGIYATGPTGVPGLDYRVDGLFQYSDGFRGLKNDELRTSPRVELEQRQSRC